MCTGLLTGCITSLSCNIAQKFNSGLSTITRLYYGMMLMSSTVVSTLMLSDWASHEMKDVLSNYWFSDYVKHPDIPKEVIGSLAVYRVMSGVCLFHICLSLLLMNVKTIDDKRAIIHDKGMCLKLIMYIMTITSMFFLPPDIFIYLTTWPFKIGGASFIMLQIMFLTSFIYDLYEGLIEVADKQRNRNIGERSIIWANCISLFLTIFGYLFTFISFFILVEKNNQSNEGCLQAIIPAALNIIMMIFVSILSISEHVREASNGAGHLNSIFQSSLVSAYSSYLILTAFINHPDKNCKIFDGDHEYMTKSVSLLFTFLAIIWSTVRSGSNKFLENKDQLLSLDNSDDEENIIQYSYSQFHLMFAFGSMYIANVLTRWGDIDVTPGNGIENPFTVGISDSELSVIIKLLSAGSCYLFYLWIMLAPPLFPERDFT